MKTIPLAAAALAVAFGAGTVLANDDADHLIKLDKRWGNAKKADDLKPLLAEKFIAVSPDGLGDRKDAMDDMKENGPPDQPYKSGDYKVRFIDDDVAVMIHSASDGDDKWWSMHVWRKHDGKWKVFATSSTPAD